MARSSSPALGKSLPSQSPAPRCWGRSNCQWPTVAHRLRPARVVSSAYSQVPLPLAARILREAVLNSWGFRVDRTWSRPWRWGRSTPSDVELLAPRSGGSDMCLPSRRVTGRSQQTGVGKCLGELTADGGARRPGRGPVLVHSWSPADRQPVASRSPASSQPGVVGICSPRRTGIPSSQDTLSRPVSLAERPRFGDSPPPAPGGSHAVECPTCRSGAALRVVLSLPVCQATYFTTDAFFVIVSSDECQAMLKYPPC